MMTDLQAIDKRVSRRSYTGGASPADAAALKKLAAKLNRKSGLAIRLIEDGSRLFGGFAKTYGMFSGVRTLLLMVGDSADPDLQEKVGYYGEQLVLEATKRGLGSCWVGGTFDKKQISRLLKPGQTLVAVITVGTVNAAKSRRENMVFRLTHSRGKSVKQMVKYDSPPPDWFWRGMEAVAQAPSAMNKQPVRFTYVNDRAHAQTEPQGLQLVDLGIAKLHFEIGAGGIFALGNGAAFAPLP